MTLDTELRLEAYNAIQTYGKSVSFVQHVASNYNIETGSETQLGRRDYSVKVSPPEMFKAKDVDGDAIRFGDVRITVPALNLPFTFDEQMTIRVVIDSQTWSIVRITPVYSGELVCVYDLQLRL